MRSLQPLSLDPPAKIDPPQQVPVEIDAEPLVLENEAVESLRAQGLAVVDNQTISRIARLGIHLKGVGVLRYHRGRSLVLQTRVDEAMMQITVAMNEAVRSKNRNKMRNLIDLANAMAKLSKAATESQALALETEQAMDPGKGNEIEPTSRKSFAAGQAIQPVQIISEVTNVGVQENKK